MLLTFSIYVESWGPHSAKRFSSKSCPCLLFVLLILHSLSLTYARIRRHCSFAYETVRELEETSEKSNQMTLENLHPHSMSFSRHQVDQKISLRKILAYPEERSNTHVEKLICHSCIPNNHPILVYRKARYVKLPTKL